MQTPEKNVKDAEAQTDNTNFFATMDHENESIFLLRQILQAITLQNTLLLNNQVNTIQVVSNEEGYGTEEIAAPPSASTASNEKMQEE